MLAGDRLCQHGIPLCDGKYCSLSMKRWLMVVQAVMENSVILFLDEAANVLDQDETGAERYTATARIYSNATRKALGGWSAVGAYCKYMRIEASGVMHKIFA